VQSYFVATYIIPKKHRNKDGYPYGEYREFEISGGKLEVYYLHTRGPVGQKEFEANKDPANNDWHIAINFQPTTG
jgi:hypothetical protein